MGTFADYAKNYNPLTHKNPFGEDVQTDYDVSVETAPGLLGSGETQQNTLTLLDGDTFVGTDGTKYRLSGAFAPEIARVTQGRQGWFDDTPRTAEIDAGEAFGQETMQAVNAVMQAGGFNRVIETGNESHGRKVAHIVNDKGENLTEALYRAGVLRPTAQTSKELVDIYTNGQAARQLGYDTGYGEILAKLDEVMQDQYARSGLTGVVAFGGASLNEHELERDQVVQNFHNQFTDVLFDDPNRTKDNMAVNSVGASMYTGWLGLKEGAYGAAELLGDSLGVDVLEEFGSLGIERTGNQKEQLANIENLSFDDVDGVYDFAQFVGNNFAMSIPYLGLIAGGAALAPVVGGGALGAAVAIVPSSSVYAGQIWNEMGDEKNAGYAIAGGVLAGALDRLGLQAIVRPSQLLTPAGKKAAIDAIVGTGKAASREEAEQLLTRATKEEALKLLQHQVQTGAAQAASVVNRGNFVKEASKGFVIGGVGEAVTEAGQETIQYTAAKLGSGEPFNAWELEDRVRDAMLAAFGPGSAFGVASSTIQYAGQDAAVRELSAADIDRLNAYDQIRERRRIEGDPPESVDDIVDDLHSKRAIWDAHQEAVREAELDAREKGKRPKQRSRIGSFANRARNWQKNSRGFYNTFKEIDSFPDAVAKAATGFGKLWNAASVTAFSPEELANADYGHTLQKIRALVGQGRGVIQPGRSFEAKTDLVYSTLAQQVYLPSVLKRFGVEGSFSDNQRGEISALLREFGRDGWYTQMKEGTEVDLPPHLAKFKDALFKTAKEMETMADNIRRTQIEARRRDGKPADDAEFGYLEGWWWKHQDLDPRKVYKNRTKFFEFLRNKTDMNEEEIHDFYDRIIGGDATALEDYFSHVRGIEFEPGHQKARTANLSEQDEFAEFAQDNMFLTLDNAARSAARYSVNLDYFGAGGRNLDILFDELEAQGMNPDKVNEVAWYTKAIIDSATGNFNRIQNPRWAAVNKFATTWSIFAGLPLSALSSIPETAMITLGLNRPEVTKALSAAGKEVASSLVEYGRQAVDASKAAGGLREVPDGADYKLATEQNRLNQAGLLWTPASAGKRVGVGEMNIAYSWWQDTFFKSIGLVHLTQAQRRASAAITTDFVANRLSELAEAVDLKNPTERQQRLYNDLTQTGMDVDRMIKIWKNYGTNEKILDYVGEAREIPAEVQAEIDEQMQTAVYNFVNLRVQAPGAANRPLFFQDPHWQLLTQFNGFISTFTANVVPKLWNDYVKRGTPQVKYQTFATIMGMVALGGASQYLKDWIKYGRITPYLDTPEQLQRAIYGSGVIGQAERVVELVAPIYGGAHRGSLAAQIAGIAVGEAGPTVRNIGNVWGAGEAALGGEGERALDRLLKTSPILAPFTGTRKNIAEALSGNRSLSPLDILTDRSRYEE